MNPELQRLQVQIFADGADLTSALELYKNPLIRGFTTNPSLMRAAGVADYRQFACTLIRAIPDRPISFEVIADEFDEMEWQALEIASWGGQVNVKIPVTNARAETSLPLIGRLVHAGVRLNVTALLTVDQVSKVAETLGNVPSYISVFAGRIADTGRDPVPVMAEAVRILERYPQLRLIWASPRELLNIFQADAIGCHVITVTHDVLRKLVLVGKDLAEYSLATVKMFYDDAQKAGLCLPKPAHVARVA